MSLKILIVDDSAVMRAMVAKTLRAAGLPLDEPLQAANGQEGLDALADNWIDVVFADINMPVMSGDAMIEKIRANPLWAELPIVVISTEGSKARIEQLRAQGIAFIHKPFTPEAVRDVITNLTGICHAEESE